MGSGSAASRYTGTRVHRVEDARLLAGRGTFVDEVELLEHAQ
jgi:carbon-monoxide dehydrogenase large subunit